jgi:GTP-binding protein
MFVDHIKIQAKAGDGGSGCASFRQEKFVPKAGPDGGDGGRGGDIVLETDVNTASLAPLFYKPIIRAKDGGRGMGSKKTGKSAPPVIVNVPVGTVVYRLPMAEAIAEADEEDFENGAVEHKSAGTRRRPPVDTSQLEMVADLDEDTIRFVLCRGGDGGQGNVHFKSSINQAPTKFTEGFPGEEGQFFLELRTIADAGLVGYPNAGKSTLLSKISAATPKVAAYPFTTLHPIVGVVEFRGYDRCTVADIPGLIEGAHRNIGLGHEFLRHILRCKLLLFVIDMAGSEGREPIDDLSALREELRRYNAILAKRPWIVVANKMDLPGAAENLKFFRRRFRKVPTIAISAEGKVGLEDLKFKLHDLIREHARVSGSD